ncbi:hypothetical protein O3M35_006065 [Rhynocoris fuscipes]|uniref:Cytochrome P450 n=1 Tax=Rhynocoris fuscipes TaxID=488301 RepID=A0AAW1DFL6_9HEMI
MIENDILLTFANSLFVILSTCFILTMYLSWNDNYWLKKKIPFVEPSKIFGNIKDVILMKRTIGEVYQQIYRKLGDKPLGGFFKLRQPILMVKHPELIKIVLKDKFDCFQANDIHVRRDTNPILKMNPLLASGATWKTMKSTFTPIEDYKTLEGMVDSMKTISGQMNEFIKDYGILSVECKNLAGKYISDVIASCALGMETNSFKEPNSEFRKMSDRLFLKTNVKSNIALLLALYAPDLANWFRYRIVPSEVSKYFIGLLSDICKYRVKENVTGNDFLQLLINVNKESEADGEGTVYNYDKITGLCMTVFIDGYMMTMNPLSYLLHDIALNEDVQEKIVEEMKSLEINTINDIDLNKIQKMTYLDMVLSESLRLHPPVQAVTRICTKKTTLTFDQHEYNVGVGTPITVPIYALHMDPKYYENPTEFIPERFTAEAKAQRNEFVYLPYGKGPRACPGAKFADLILKVAVISILTKFKMRLRDPLRTLKQDPRSSLINSAKGELMIHFVDTTTDH